MPHAHTHTHTHFPTPSADTRVRALDSCTFWHLLQHAEDGTPSDEGPGLEEVHGGRKVRPHHLLLLHSKQTVIQPLLGVRQDRPPARLHGGLLLHEGPSLSRVRGGQDCTRAAQEQADGGRAGALWRHVPQCARSWREQPRGVKASISEKSRAAC